MLLDFGCFYFVIDLFASDIDEDQNDHQFSSMTLVFEALGTNVFFAIPFYFSNRKKVLFLFSG